MHWTSELDLLRPGLRRVGQLLIASSLLAVVSVAVPAAAATTISKTYYLPTGDAATVGTVPPTDTCDQPDPGVGGACFAPLAGPSLEIAITDQSGQPVATALTFYDSNGKSLLADKYLVCGSATPTKVSLPEGTVRLYVRVGVVQAETLSLPTPKNVPPKTACATPSPASTGTITISGKAVEGASSGGQSGYAGSSRTASSAVHSGTMNSSHTGTGRSTVRAYQRAASGLRAL
jgi:hypothetical protein